MELHLIATECHFPYGITYPGGMEGWADLDDLLNTEMVFPPADGHTSKY